SLLVDALPGASQPQCSGAQLGLFHSFFQQYARSADPCFFRVPTVEAGEHFYFGDIRGMHSGLARSSKWDGGGRAAERASFRARTGTAYSESVGSPKQYPVKGLQALRCFLWLIGSYQY